MTRKQKLTLCIIAVILGLGIALYPLIYNFYTEKTRSVIETKYTEAVEMMQGTILDSTRRAAEEYNALILRSADYAFSRELLDAVSEYYDSLLDVRGDGIMGYIEIPRISVNLPIYHGSGEEALSRGVGHLLGSSLPIGGYASHCVLTGHSGMARDKMFSDLELLEPGDTFYLHVLDETLAYEVRDIFTVLPEDCSLIHIEGQHDYCTLITCTPFAVNSHRLLVRGERIPYSPELKAEEDTRFQTVERTTSAWTAAYLRGILYGLAAAVALAAVILVLRFLLPYLRKRRFRPSIWLGRAAGRKRGRHEIS